MRTTISFVLNVRHDPTLSYPGPWVIFLEGIVHPSAFAADDPFQITSGGYKSYFYRMAMR